MKTKSLEDIHFMARTMPYSEFSQQLKSEFTGQPYTVVIDCELVLVDWKDVSDLEHQVDELIMGDDF